MTPAAWAALVLAAVAAGADWWSVARDRRGVEAIAKPAVLVALIAAATAVVPADPAVRTAVVVGLTLGLIGDVLLFYDQFLPGATAFLAGHIAYLVAFLLVPLHGVTAAAGLVVLAAILAVVARPVLSGARRRSAVLAGVVAAYLIALGAVLVLGMATANPWVMAGVVLFSVSDALLAYGRFVGPAPGGRVAVHVTYHLAQAALVLALPTLA